MKTFRGLAVVAICAAMGAAVPAGAGTILYKQNGSDTFNGGGKTHVKVEREAASPFSAKTVSALAGGFRLKDSIGDFVAWCLDIDTTLNIPNAGRTYETTTTPFAATSGEIAGSRLTNVKNLFQTAYKTLDLASNTPSAAFQLALWEILYETSDTLSLSNGTFEQIRDTSDANRAEAAANSLLAGLGGPVTQHYAFTFWESPEVNGIRSQNLVSVSEVPLPAPVLLLIAGLGGLAALRRKRPV